MALICQVRYKRINQSLCVLNIYITNKHKTLLAVGEFCCCKTKKSKSPGISGTPQQPSMIQALIRGREGQFTLNRIRSVVIHSAYVVHLSVLAFCITSLTKILTGIFTHPINAWQELKWPCVGPVEPKITVIGIVWIRGSQTFSLTYNNAI